MRIEKANADDIKELVELREEYLKEDLGEIPQIKMSLIGDNLPAYFSDHLGRDLIAFVCRGEGAIMGCCFLYISEKPPNPTFINGRTGTVLNVYTRPPFRKQGIARELMRALLAEAERRSLDYVELKATEEGYELYKSIGFKDEIPKYHSMKYIIDYRNRF